MTRQDPGTGWRLSWAVALFALCIIGKTTGQGASAAEMEGTARLVIQDGHTGLVYHTAYSPDGKYLATCSVDKTVRLWSEGGMLLNVLEGHGAAVTHVSFSPDGSIIASASTDIRLWSREGKLLKVLDGKGMAVFSPDGARLVTLAGDRGLRLWTSRGEAVATLTGHRDVIQHIAFSPDSKTFVSTSLDGTLCLWSREGALLRVMEGHTGPVNHATFSPDGTRIASSSYDTTARIWDSTGRHLRTLAGHTLSVNRAAYSPDGMTLATCSGSGNDKRDATVRLWDADGRPLKVLSGHKESVGDVAFSKDGKILLSRSHTSVRIWTRAGELIKTLAERSGEKLVLAPSGKSFATGVLNDVHVYSIDGRMIRTLQSRTDNCRHGAFSPDGKYLAAAYDNGTVRLWGRDGRLARVMKGHERKVMRVAFSPDGTRLASSSDDGSICLWSIDGRLLHSLKGVENVVYQLVFSPDGKYLASASWDGTVKLWDADGRMVHSLEGHNDTGIHIAFSPDGRTIATCTPEHRVLLWSTDGKLQRTLEGHTATIRQIAFSPDGKILASFAEDDTLRLWSEGVPVVIGAGHVFNGVAVAFAFSPDSRSIIIGSSDKKTRIFTVEGRFVKALEGQSCRVSQVLFSPDGKMFAALSDDRTIGLWTPGGEKIRGISCDNAPIFAAFSPDSGFLAVVSRDKTVKLCDARAGKEIVTLLGLDGDSGVAYTPDNYYRMSGDAVKALAFEKNMKSYGFDQFDLRFNRPDVIMGRLYPGAAMNDDLRKQMERYRGYWKYRVQQNGFTEGMASGATRIHAPEIFAVKIDGVDLERADTRREGRHVRIGFSARDEKGSALDVIGYKIFVNGVPLYGQYIRRFAKPAKVQKIEETVELSSVADIGGNPGDNRIEISAFTGDGVESGRETLFVTYAGADSSERGDLHIVSLGIDDYSKSMGFESLEYAVGDSIDMAKVFSEAGKKNFRRISVTRLSNGEVNREALRGIKERLSRTRVDDTVIFFMAGHGVRADTPVSEARGLSRAFGLVHDAGDPSTSPGKVNVYYYITGDSDSGRPWVSAIPMEAIRDTLDRIPARQKLLLIDTCQSGEDPSLSGFSPSQESLEEIRKKRGAGTHRGAGPRLVRRGIINERGIAASTSRAADLKDLSMMFPELRRGTGTIEISAATGVQSALESEEWNNGAFTYVVKEALLAGKARDRDGRVTARSLRRYVLDRVEELTGGDQTPMVCRDIAGRDFVVSEK